jgi:hypothetical protein
MGDFLLIFTTIRIGQWGYLPIGQPDRIGGLPDEARSSS